MIDYASIDVDKIKLDLENPRIADTLESRKEVKEELVELALGAGKDVSDANSTSYSSLKESIKAEGKIIEPIIVKPNGDGTYTVIEGNTRVQIYRTFKKSNTPGNWDKIIAMVVDDEDEDYFDRVRLQCHLVGTRPWDPYAKARYLYKLSEIDKKPLNELVPFCGGRATEVVSMIEAYKDMENYYRPLTEERGVQFNPKKYSAFREFQNRNILDAVVRSGFTKNDFAKWVIDENIDTMQGPRSLPKILNDDEARDVFLKKNVTEAKKIISAKEIKGYEDFENMPLEKMISVISNKLVKMPWPELENIKSDPAYIDTKNAIYELKEDVDWFIDTNLKE